MPFSFFLDSRLRGNDTLLDCRLRGNDALLDCRLRGSESLGPAVPSAPLASRRPGQRRTGGPVALQGHAGFSPPGERRVVSFG
jgi:hypothetical protein